MRGLRVWFAMMCLLPAHAAAACHVRLPRHSESVLSADKRHIAFIRQVPSVNVPDGQAGELWLGDCASGETRRLLPARFSGVEATSQWTSLRSPVFSSDSRHVFVNAAYGGDDLLIQRVTIETGQRAFVISGQVHGVVRAGRYRDDLLVSRHASCGSAPAGTYGCYPFFIVTPDGRVLRRIAGSAVWREKDAARWLRHPR